MGQGRLRNQTALVTGASGGIGYELALILAAEGFHVVLVARDAAKLNALAQKLRQDFGINAAVLPQDLNQPDAAAAIFRQVQQMKIQVDVLVNNAGFGTHGPFLDSDWDAEMSIIQVNIAALTHLTRLFLPGMAARRSGKILNVASTAAFQPGPMMAVYYASKAFVLLFAEAIANELKSTGVTVTVLCPGPTTTGFQGRARVGQTKMMSGRIADAKSVAWAGFKGMMQGRGLVIPGFRNKLLVFLVRLFPRKFVAAIVRSIQDSRTKLTS